MLLRSKPFAFLFMMPLIHSHVAHILKAAAGEIKGLHPSPGIIERGLDAKRQALPKRYDDLTSGQYGGFLGSLGRHYGPGGDLTLP